MCVVLELVLCGVVDAGVGYGALIAAAWLNVFYIVVLAWAIYYLIASMAAELPWASCGQWWNTPNCRSFYHACGNESNGTSTTTTEADTDSLYRENFTSPVREFWEYVFLASERSDRCAAGRLEQN